MNPKTELHVRRWLDARDPGPSRPALRDRVHEVAGTERPARFPGLALTLRAGFGVAPIARPLLIAVLAVLMLGAVVGALLLQPWRPFPPRGLIAYSAPFAASGSTGITLVSADGVTKRRVSASVPDVIDASPRWSADGRTLAFGRTADLSAFGSCEGTGSIVLYDVATGTERVLAAGLRPMGAVEWTPSEAHIAFLWPPPGCGAPGELGLVDVASGKVTTTALGDGSWRLQPSGTAVEAVDSGPIWEVDSQTGELVARCEPVDGAFAGHVEVTNRVSGEQIDLGIGSAPAWSPDESAIAFIRVTPGPARGTGHGASVAIAGVDGWRVQVLADVTDPVFAEFGDVGRLPELHWTRDGAAIYWIDAAGAHVVDVVTRRVVGIPAIPELSGDLRWQPIPG